MEWPSKINIWGTTLLIGPFLFPALAGYILEGTQSWRDCFKVLAGLYAFSTVMILVFGYETYHDRTSGAQQVSRVQTFFAIGNTQNPKTKLFSASMSNTMRLMFAPPILLIGLSTMINCTWPIGITTTIDSFVRGPSYGFGNIADASIRFAGVVGALLGFCFGYFFNEWIYNGSNGRRKTCWRSEYRLHGVWFPIGSMVCGLLTYGLTLDKEKSWVGLAFGWVMVNIGLTGSTV